MINGEAELDGAAGQTNADGVVGAGYVDWRDNGTYAIVGGAVGQYDFETTRNVTFNNAPQSVSGESEGTTYSAFAAFGRKFDVGNWRLSASARVNYVSTEIDGYEEAGTSQARVSVDDFEGDSVAFGVRVRAETEYVLDDDMSLLPQVGGGVVYESALGDRDVPVRRDLASRRREPLHGRSAGRCNAAVQRDHGHHRACAGRGRRGRTERHRYGGRPLPVLIAIQE
jgi:hypothetical protein